MSAEFNPTPDIPKPKLDDYIESPRPINFAAIDAIITKCTTPPEDTRRLKPAFGKEVFLEKSELDEIEHFLGEAETQIRILQNNDYYWGEFRDKLDQLVAKGGFSWDGSVIHDIEDPKFAELRKRADPDLAKKVLGLMLNKLRDGTYEKGKGIHMLAPKSTIQLGKLDSIMSSARNTVVTYKKDPSVFYSTSTDPLAQELKELTEFMKEIKK